MAVVIEKRPIGFVLGTCVSANINSDYSSAWATVNKTTHNLQDGDYVYIQSDVENYNGFWQIDVQNANEFLLIDAPYVAFIINANITYCPVIQTHGWQCAHLPIVYELSNTKYPTNSVDTVRTISSITSDNNLVNLNLSGSLGTFEDLSFIKISNCPDSDFDGVYQVLDKISTSDVTINLDYASTPASAITGASIQLYYGNYNIVVNVYAGLTSSHLWASEKPYELAATLELIPDSDNRVKFSINEILKAYVETSNNLLQPTLPNNLDAFTQFYIEVAEQYDTSNGYTVTTFEGAFASDQSVFEGYAVNAMLPFKNIHSGHLSAYINPIAWLTLFDELTVFSDQYFDLSFINPDKNINVGYRVNGVNYLFNQTASDGIFRFKPEIAVGTTQAIVYITQVGIAQQPQNNTFTGTLSPWTNRGSSGIDWVYNSNAARITLLSGETSNYLSSLYTIYQADDSVFVTSVTIGYTIDNPSPQVDIEIVGINTGSNPVVIDISVLSSASGTLSFDIGNLSENYQYFGILVRNQSGVTIIATVDNVTFAYVASHTISDALTINISSECSSQDIDLQWINNLGGFESFRFLGEKGYAVSINDAGETKQNTFPNWPKSYGETSDTIRKQTFRDSNNQLFIISQELTEAEADAISYIKSSPLVQIVNSRQDRRTIIIDAESFTKYTDNQKMITISFNASYTDNIPSQRV